METVNYPIWDWSKNDSSQYYTAYYNDFLVCVHLTLNLTFNALNTWKQIGTVTLPEGLTPVSTVYIPTLHPDFLLRIRTNGAVEYYNNSGGSLDLDFGTSVTYARANSLP